jgi:23S rRNA (adenine2503-C2)-methyltransferase
LKEIRHKVFGNGVVYALETHDGMPIEVTDTFLSFYTKDAVNNNHNKLNEYYVANRSERWMIGVSCMSGCPVGCKFCATGALPKWRALTAEELVAQITFVIDKNPSSSPGSAQEFKINYTRMGEPFLNLEAVKEAIGIVDSMYPTVKIHHYIIVSENLL